MKQQSRFIYGMTALTVFLNAGPAFAQIKAVPMGVGAVLQQAPGNYNFKQYDETKLQTEILSVLEKRSSEDKEFVLNSVRLLNMAVNDLINENLTSGLRKMSDESMNNGLAAQISPVTFLAAKRNFEASIERINLLINQLTSLPSVMKENATLDIAGRLQQIQNRLKVNMSPVVQAYTTQVQDIVKSINSLSFMIRANNGTPFVQVGLILNDEFKKNRYSAEEIQNLRNQAAALKVLSTKELEAIKQFNLFTLNNLNSAIESYGKAYRMNMDEQGKSSALNSIEQIFFARSILRAQYGIALGTPKINYNLKTFNWDFFSAGNELTFSELGVTASKDQIDLHNSLATALHTQEARIKEVFGNNNNVFSRVTSAITYLKGEKARVGLNVIMLKLLMSDLEEEMKLTQPGGRRALRGMIQARYYSTKENEAYFKQLGKNISGAKAKNDAWADNGQVGVETLPQIYNLLVNFLKGYQSKLTQAQGIEAALAEMGSSLKNEQTINDDLFGE